VKRPKVTPSLAAWGKSIFANKPVNYITNSSKHIIVVRINKHTFNSTGISLGKKYE